MLRVKKSFLLMAPMCMASPRKKRKIGERNIFCKVASNLILLKDSLREFFRDLLVVISGLSSLFSTLVEFTVALGQMT